MTIYQRVFVDLKGERFHVKPDCRYAQPVLHWCAAAAAHRSRLEACGYCASDLARELKSALGSIPSGARKGLGLPRLHAVSGRPETEESGEDADAALYYGAPDGLDDPRFATRSLVDWGTASFGQDPDEFLGGPTDDDNDWRGGNRLYD
jgi:hypothetical protein